MRCEGVLLMDDQTEVVRNQLSNRGLQVSALSVHIT